MIDPLFGAILLLGYHVPSAIKLKQRFVDHHTMHFQTRLVNSGS